MNPMEVSVRETAAKLLEDWAMMLVEPAENDPNIFSNDSPLFLATLEFKGVVSGICRVVCQDSFGEVLVNNLLGSDDVVDDVAVSDALKEMVNVMCGNLLTLCYGVDTVFDLTPPKVRICSTDELIEVFRKPIFCFIADDFPVAVSFVLDI